MPELIRNSETITLIVFFIFFAIFEGSILTKNKEERKIDFLGFVLLVISASITKEFFYFCFKNQRLNLFNEFPSILKCLLAFMITDFIIYWIHRIMHTNKTLWRTHIFHHSITQLNQISGFRTSFIHALLFAIPQIFISISIFNLSVTETAFLFSMATFVQLWQHSDITTPIDKYIEWIYITPRFHKVHHSSGNHMNFNFAASLTIWDRIFNSYLSPDKVKLKSLGIKVKNKNLIKHMFGI